MSSEDKIWKIFKSALLWKIWYVIKHPNAAMIINNRKELFILFILNFIVGGIIGIILCNSYNIIK